MKARSTIALTGPQRVQLAAHILRSERTVYRCYKGGGTDQTRAAVAKGATELGLPLPPPPSTPSSETSPTESPPMSKAA